MSSPAPQSFWTRMLVYLGLWEEPESYEPVAEATPVQSEREPAFQEQRPPRNRRGPASQPDAPPPLARQPARARAATRQKFPSRACAHGRWAFRVGCSALLRRWACIFLPA